MSLLIKYRPSSWDEVLGQDRVLDSLETVVSKRQTHSFLLVGPSGCGKTTLARLIAKNLGCSELNLIETDPATHPGVEDIREVISTLNTRPPGGGTRVVIVDECQLYSKNVWTALLKISEDPPSWVYWVFCTTDAGKVPSAMKTRAASYELRPVARADLEDIVVFIARSEKMDVRADVMALCADEAGGSPRQAISNLVVCAGAKSRAEAIELLKNGYAEDEAGAFELAQVLYKTGGASWEEMRSVLAKLHEAGANPEGVRQVVRAYGTKMLLGNPKSPQSVCAVLNAFSTPFNSADKVTPVLLACANLCFGD